MQRRNDCLGCVMPEERNKYVGNRLVTEEYCPYNQTYPHAVNCSTAHYEIVHDELGAYNNKEDV